MRTLGFGLLFSFLASAGCQPDSAAQDVKPTPPKVGFAEGRDPKPGNSEPTEANPVDGDRAVKYLKHLCDLGPRISGTDGMAKQQELLTKHFEKSGAKVARQEFSARQPSQKADVALVNLIASWNPARKERIILCAHYDTRPYADQEANPRNWTKPFVSANDGTSGVALLMELAHHMKDSATTVGVDFVIFDGEEYVFSGPEKPGDPFFLGSTHFANEYAKNHKAKKIDHQYTAAVLFDLFAHPNAKLNIEGFSWDNSKDLVLEIWKVADAQKAKSFKFARGFARSTHCQDDHVPLQKVGINAIDIVDFDYGDWHKLSDTPDKCSGVQLAEVGGVVLAWLKGK